MSPLGKKNMRVHFYVAVVTFCVRVHFYVAVVTFLRARVFFFLYMLIKKYPTCPTILPHADKAR